MLTNLLLVALGGGLGAAGRWLLSLAPFPAAFPFATLLTNFLGAAVIGAIAALAERSPLPRRLSFRHPADQLLGGGGHRGHCRPGGALPPSPPPFLSPPC